MHVCVAFLILLSTLIALIVTFPGMGSTGISWGWASRSQVFGGSRACLAPQPVFDMTEVVAGEDSSDLESSKEEYGVTSNTKDCEGRTEYENLQGGGEDSAAVPGRRGGAKRENDEALQVRNFRIMYSWLSSSNSSTSIGGCTTQPLSSAKSEMARWGWATAAMGVAKSRSPSPTLLEVALTRRDGGLAAAFVKLASLDPEASGQWTDDDPVALALRLYHAASTWRRISRRPTPRRRGLGPGSRLHPNSPHLAATADEADAQARARRAKADFASGLALINAGLAVSLDDASGDARQNKTEASGSNKANDERCTDTLAALVPSDALTATETRALAKALGVARSMPTTSEHGNGGGSSAGKWSGKAHRDGRGRSSSFWGSGGAGSGHDARCIDGKEEVCNAIEQWVSRPPDPAKRRARIARMAQTASSVIAGVGTKRGGVLRGRGNCGDAEENGNSGDVIVLRLADDAREAIHRINVAFFAAARHAPHDTPALLREDLTRVSFGNSHPGGDSDDEADGGDADRRSTDDNNAGRGKHGDDSNIHGGDTPLLPREPVNDGTKKLRATDSKVGNHSPTPDDPTEAHQRDEYRRPPGSVVSMADDGGLLTDAAFTGSTEVESPRPPPDILSSVENFSEFYRLVGLADALDLAAEAGDSG